MSYRPNEVHVAGHILIRVFMKKRERKWSHEWGVPPFSSVKKCVFWTILIFMNHSALPEQRPFYLPKELLNI